MIWILKLVFCATSEALGTVIHAEALSTRQQFENHNDLFKTRPEQSLDFWIVINSNLIAFELILLYIF